MVTYLVVLMVVAVFSMTVSAHVLVHRVAAEVGNLPFRAGVLHRHDCRRSSDLDQSTQTLPGFKLAPVHF